MLSLLYGPTLTSIHDYWKNHSFDYTKTRLQGDQTHSVLKEISPEYSLEGLMLKLKFQYFGHPMRRTDSLEKILMLGKTEAGGKGDDRGRDGWTASLTRWTWVWASSRSWYWTGKPGVLHPMGSQRVRDDWVTDLNWPDLIDMCIFLF